MKAEKPMQIVLKQKEIEAAIRQYIGTQVILRNKSVAIDFTAGRGNNGLSVELTIEDISIPGDDVGLVKEPAPLAVEPTPVAKEDQVTAADQRTNTLPSSTVAAEANTGTLAEAAQALLVPSDIPAQAAILTAAVEVETTPSFASMNVAKAEAAGVAPVVAADVAPEEVAAAVAVVEAAEAKVEVPVAPVLVEAVKPEAPSLFGATPVAPVEQPAVVEAAPVKTASLFG